MVDGNVVQHCIGKTLFALQKSYPHGIDRHRNFARNPKKMSGTIRSEPILDWYIYKPVHGASAAFAVLFAVSGCAHIWQNNLKYRSFRIGFLLPWAALIFTAGFILREYGSYHTDNLNIFIASTVLLFVAPPVYNGANYFIFGRALYYLPYLSPLHPGRVWTTFITLDTFADIIAGNGASRAVNANATPLEREIGFTLVKVSLFLLIGMFLAFMCMSPSPNHAIALTPQFSMFCFTIGLLKLVFSTTDSRL